MVGGGTQRREATSDCGYKVTGNLEKKEKEEIHMLTF